MIDDNPLLDRTANALLTLGLAYSQTDQTDKAIETFERFLKDFPDHMLAPTAKDLMESLKPTESAE